MNISTLEKVELIFSVHNPMSCIPSHIFFIKEKDEFYQDLTISDNEITTISP